MTRITPRTNLTTLAAIVSEALEEAGIVAVLSGGGAVSAYTQNVYQSLDLDFVTSEQIPVLADALGPLGFIRGEADTSTTRTPSTSSNFRRDR